jgi:RND family efflux transporter MFP subunit
MKKALAIAIPIIVIGGLVGWRYVTKKASDKELQTTQASRRNSSASVVLATAAPKTISESLDTVGSVESPYNIKLGAQVSGRIDFLQVREGDAVTPDQVLVRIDPTEVEGQVLQGQAAVAEAQSRLAQAQVTQGSTNVGITSTIRQNQAALGSSRADYNQVFQNYSATVATADAAVTDSQAKVAAAKSAVDSAEASVESAQANENNAKTKYDRTNSLYKQGFVAAQDVDDARTAYEVAAASTKVAQKQYASTKSALNSADAILHSSEAQAAIARRKGKSDIADAQAKVDQAKATLEVANANRSQAPAYQANLAALQSEVSSQEAQLRQAEARRAYTVIKSPIEGTVTSRLMDPGATATPGSQILVIEYLKWVYVTGSVPVEESGVVVPGMPATIVSDSVPGRTFTGNIAEVNKSADPQSRQFTVRVRLDNPGNVLRPGMFAHMTFVLRSTNAAVTVPREAVKQLKDGAHVFVVTDNVAHDTLITLGASDSQSYEVTSGLKPGDKVVALSYQPIKDKSKIREQTADAKGGKGGKGGGAGKGGGKAGGGAPQ